jgi:hypothetical protein
LVRPLPSRSGTRGSLFSYDCGAGAPFGVPAFKEDGTL